MILGTHGCSSIIEVGYHLVVAIHKVNFEALDAHLAVVTAHMLHIAVKGVIARPKYQPHIAFLGILHQHGQVNLRHNLEKVCFLVHRPALIKDYILYPHARGKVNVVLIGVVVDARLERHTTDVPVVPPVPCHLAGAHPADVLHPARRSQQVAHIVHRQGSVVPRHHGNAPRQLIALLDKGNVILPFLNKQLQVVVSALLHRLGIAGMLTLQPHIHSRLPIHSPRFQVQTREMLQMSLGQAHLHPVWCVHQQRQECQSSPVHLRQGQRLV